MREKTPSIGLGWRGSGDLDGIWRGRGVGLAVPWLWAMSVVRAAGETRWRGRAVPVIVIP